MSDRMAAGVTRADLEQAMKEMDTYLDVSVDDLMEIYHRAQHHVMLRLVEDRPVSEFIEPNVIVARPRESVMEAGQRFIDHRIGILPVVDAEKKLVGVLTEADVLSLVGLPHHRPGTRLHEIWDSLLGHHEDRRSAAERVEELMSARPLTVHRDAPVGEVVHRMKEKHVKTLIVINANREVCGVISRSTILKAILKNSAASRQAGV